MSTTMLSRVADHLYWMGRYAERAEHTARVLNVHTHLALEESGEARKIRFQQVLVALRQPRMPFDTFQEAASGLTLELRNSSSLMACVQACRENARQIRERIASEMWEQINRLYLHLSSEERDRDLEARPHEFYQRVIESLHLFNGLTDSTMSRDQAWLFIQAGRYLERAGLLVSLFNSYLPRADSLGYLDWLGALKCCTAFEAYRKTIGVDLGPVSVGGFLILSETFPHSLRFSVSQLRRSLQELAQQTENRKTRELDRVVGKMHHDLEYARAEEVFGGDPEGFFQRFQADLRKVHELVYRLYISWELEF